jgi:hypothetical protein
MRYLLVLVLLGAIAPSVDACCFFKHRGHHRQAQQCAPMQQQYQEPYVIMVPVYHPGGQCPPNCPCPGHGPTPQGPTPVAPSKPTPVPPLPNSNPMPSQ